MTFWGLKYRKKILRSLLKKFCESLCSGPQKYLKNIRKKSIIPKLQSNANKLNLNENNYWIEIHQGLVEAFLGTKVSAFFPSGPPQQFKPVGLFIEPKTGVVLYFKWLVLDLKKVVKLIIFRNLLRFLWHFWDPFMINHFFLYSLLTFRYTGGPR